MVDINEILGRPIEELTEDELEARLNALKRMRRHTTSSRKAGARPKSNKEKSVFNMLKQLSPEEIAELNKYLSKKQGGEGENKSSPL